MCAREGLLPHPTGLLTMTPTASEPRRAVAVLLLAAALPTTLLAAPAPPVAPRVPHPVSLHGESRPDDYYWLRDKKDPKVIQYLEAENAYTDSMTAASKPLADGLYDEMLGRIKQTDLSVPYRRGEFL